MENQKINEDNQKIIIELPSTLNLKKNRQLIPTSFAAVIVFFFFSFFELQCGERKIVTVTGINLVTGTGANFSEKANVAFDIGDREPKGGKIHSLARFWAVSAILLALIGLFAFLLKLKKEATLGYYAGMIGFFVMIILYYVVSDFVETESKGFVDVSIKPPFWGVLIGFGIAGLLSYLRIGITYDDFERVNKEKMNDSKENISTETTLQSEILKSDLVNENEIKINSETDLNKQIAHQETKKNKKNNFGILSLLIVLIPIASIIIYFKFFNSKEIDNINEGVNTSETNRAKSWEDVYQRQGIDINNENNSSKTEVIDLSSSNNNSSKQEEMTEIFSPNDDPENSSNNSNYSITSYKNINFKKVSYEDYKGRTFYEYQIIRDEKNISNKELFVLDHKELIQKINTEIQKEYDLLLKDSYNSDCLSGVNEIKKINLEDLQITVDKTDMVFFYNLSLGGACQSINEIQINFKLEDMDKYIAF